MRSVRFGLTFGLLSLLAGASARAALLDSSAYLANPSFSNPFDATSYVANSSFESPTLTLYTTGGLDRCNYQSTLPGDWSGGWTDTGTQTSLYHYRPGTNGLKSNGGYFWDPTDGVNGAAVILRSTGIPAGWIYQSLGTVGEEDIGLIFIATIDSSIRFSTANHEAQRQVSFRTGVIAGRNGDFGDLASMGLDTATRQSSFDDPWHTLADWFQPAEEHLGQEIFLVFSAQDVSGSFHGQYQFDNVRLWVVPEPSAMCLITMSLLSLLCCMRQRRAGR